MEFIGNIGSLNTADEIRQYCKNTNNPKGERGVEEDIMSMLGIVPVILLPDMHVG